ncbi:MAG: thrombospondin type 3 repeat-containing protein, partial [Thermodesulfobacteriota bacterium]|nr:thrombospondin type 3 repeat-containing protein [Thermodesulfobacteriota bacterium]
QDFMDITGPPTGSWNGGTKVHTGENITWIMHITIDTDNLIGHSAAWEIYITDDTTDHGGYPLNPGPGFTTVTDNYLFNFADNGYVYFSSQYRSVDGIGADTIGSGGYGVSGIPQGTDVDWVEFTTSLDPSLDGQGKYLCIDSCWYTPSNPYVWSFPQPVGEIPAPAWGGPYCYMIADSNRHPVVSDIPDQTILVGDSFATINLDDYVDDVDNADEEMTWTFTGNTELTVDITNRVATITIPSAEWDGSETITFTATDPDDLFDSDDAIFTVTRPKVFVLSADTLYFEAYEDIGDTTSQYLYVTEEGDANVPFNVSASNAMEWLNVPDTMGVTPDTIWFQTNVDGMSPGVYLDSMTVYSDSAENSPEFYIQFTVLHRDRMLVVSPDTLFFDAIVGGDNPDSQAFTIEEAYDDAIDFATSDVADWLDATGAGTTPGSVYAKIDISGISDGTFFTNINITSEIAVNDPLSVVVKLIVRIDSDGDGIPDVYDNCPNEYNPEQDDDDSDTVGNVCDNCPDSANANQQNSDS